MAVRLAVFGDMHVPYHDPVAVEIFLKTMQAFKPDIIVCLGDVMDCIQFSSYIEPYGMPVNQYEQDIQLARDLLERVRQQCSKLVFLEGNHEYRIDRWAGSTKEGQRLYKMIAPRHMLKDVGIDVYIPYLTLKQRYPYYRINSRLIAVHGWTYAKHATKNHLTLSQGKSVIHGHTHNADVAMIQGLWASNSVVEARSAGCLCRRIPLYNTGRPVEWVHAFIIGYLGRRSDTLYTIPIYQNRCILPDGKEIHV